MLLPRATCSGAQARLRCPLQDLLYRFRIARFCFSKNVSITSRNIVKTDLPSRKAATATSSAAFRATVLAPPASAAS